MADSSSVAANFSRLIASSTAPGGLLSRKPIVLGIAAGLLVVFVGVFFAFNASRGEKDPAAVRLTDPAFVLLPTRSLISVDPETGHREVREYGQLDDKEMDATVMMVMPPAGQGMTRDAAHELNQLKAINNMNVAMEGAYDLVTRYGSFRMIEFRVDLGGRFKQCFAYMSRFDTASVYVKGWFCDAVGARMAAGKVACMLDGLTFAPVASVDADEFLASRAARPPICATKQISTAEPRLRPRPPSR